MMENEKDDGVFSVDKPEINPIKLKALGTIKNYKSYKDFSWCSFNKEKLHDKFNIFLGENGMGKSSICDILKSISRNSSLEDGAQSEIEVSLLTDEEEEIKYSKGKWDKNIKNNSDDPILFFDREFINEYIHTNHHRAGDQHGHEQKSGDLILRFDKDAINLEREVKELEKKYNDHKKKVDDFKEQQERLGVKVEEEEKKLFEKFEDKPKEKNNKRKENLKKYIRKLENKKENLEDRKGKIAEIQSINKLYLEETSIPSLSLSKDYQAIFNFDLKENLKAQVEKNLLKKIKDNKDFFDTGFKIRENYPSKCPFCQTEEREPAISEIKENFGKIFDDSYKKQLEKFEEKKQEKINELQKIEDWGKEFDLQDVVFNKLIDLDKKFKENFFSPEDSEKYGKKLKDLKLDEIKKFKEKISKLIQPNQEDVKEIYDLVKKELDAIRDFYEDLKKFVSRKNQDIENFKNKHTDEKLKMSISKNEKKLKLLVSAFDFLNKEKIDKEKQKKQLESELRKEEKKLNDKKEEYKKYLEENPFKNFSKQIKKFFNDAEFEFKLVPYEKSRNQKNPPFAFYIEDEKGRRRTTEEGLSEGEMQVLSFCFFFAFLSIQEALQNKIVVFDDPITSLDNNNLEYLVDLIIKEKDEFSQILIFTHHSTFFKFLRKKIGGKKDKKYKEYNILKNKEDLGGSFICGSKVESVLDKLKRCVENYENPKTSFDMETEAIEYGQLLRYEVENFIKNDLLQWNKSKAFGNIIEGIEYVRSVEPANLEKIERIYSFCNWTTEHVDTNSPEYGTKKLFDHVKQFVTIKDAYEAEKKNRLKANSNKELVPES